MKKKYFIITIFLLTCLLLYNIFLKQININLSGRIYFPDFSSDSIPEEYVSNSDYLKKIEINVHVTGGTLLIKNLSISIDDLSDLISQEKDLKELGNSEFKFPKEMISNQSIVIFSETKSEKDILNIIKDGRVIISWENALGKAFNETYYFKDFIKL